MSWDLICIKPHTHRPEGEEAYACLHKSIAQVEREGVNAVQYTVRVVPLPLLADQGGEKRLISMEEALFKAVADLNEKKVMFDIGGADAALPTLLRGGGLGSLAISELVLWAQKHYSEFGVVSGRISSTILNYSNGEANAIRSLKNLGFNVTRSPKGGLQFLADQVSQLRTHVNTSKVETATPALWYSNLMQDNLNVSRQVKTQVDEISNLKEQLYQSTQQKRSSAPFMSGLFMGLVAGAALAGMLFSL